MSKKMTFADLFHRTSPAANKPAQEQAAETEELTYKLKSAEVETRFREALASGKITGDITVTDDQGNVVREMNSPSIFDL